MAAEAVVRFAVILAAALTIAAVPASAQTNNSTDDQTRIDCRNGTNAAGADCAKDNEKDGSGATRPGAVFLPALIVDLFPNPAETPVPVPTPAPRQDPGTPPAAPADPRSGSTSAAAPASTASPASTPPNPHQRSPRHNVKHAQPPDADRTKPARGCQGAADGGTCSAMS